MSFQVPAHVLPIRKQVTEFIEQRVYPVEHLFVERGSPECAGEAAFAGEQAGGIDCRLIEITLGFVDFPLSARAFSL